VPRPPLHDETHRPDIATSESLNRNHGRADRECSLLDVSPAGAKVIVDDISRIPDRFDLADKQQKCEVTWRRGKIFGAKFVV
jgi:hypothetical protein